MAMYKESLWHDCVPVLVSLLHVDFLSLLFFVGIAAVADQIDKHSRHIRDAKNTAEELKVLSTRSAPSRFVCIRLHLIAVHIDF